MRPPYPIRLLEWDTCFFGLKMGAVDLPPVDFPVTENDWGTTAAQARNQGFRFLYCPIDAARQHEANIIAKSGAILGDVLLSFSLKIKTLRDIVSPQTGGNELAVAPAKAPDLPALQEIAADSFEYSRFYLDPRFGKDKASRLYQNWLLESFQNDQILTAQAAGNILGFISYAEDPSLKKLSIRLLAVRPQGRGRGVGGALVSGLVEMTSGGGFETISVGTQMNNYGAVRFYEKMGFRLTDAKYRFHLWLDESS